MSNAVLLAFTPDANMRAVGEAADAAGLALMLCGPGESPSRSSLPRDRPLVLLAVGPEGGATLAAWVAKHGLDGVAGVGLVGVTAPWAEPFRTTPPIAERLVAALEASRVYGGARAAFVDLGPVEQLREAAERARVGVSCKACGGAGWRYRDGKQCPECGGRRRNYPLRFVIACATDDGVCSACGGKAAHQYREGSPYNMLCAPCQGTGKALSSLDVAAELVGSLPGPWTANPATFGGADGVQGLLYPTRAALDEHGLRAVIARLAR